MGSNGSRDVPKENQEGQAATPAAATPPQPSPIGSSTRRSRAGFSDSFSNHGNNFIFFFSSSPELLVFMHICRGTYVGILS